MITTVVNVKVEPEIKKEAQKVADNLGLTLSAIIKAYLKELVRTQKVSFGAEEPSEFLINSLRTAEEDIQKGRVSSTFSKADGAISWLKSNR